jgi:CelD/BcsL family acetyltransferase involved in cellulose biosynthesis
MIEVDRASWKGESIVGVAAPERADFFRRFILAASAAGWSRLYLLRHGGRDVAFSYLLDAGSSVTGYKMSFVEEFSEYRPGAVLLARAIADSFGSGRRVFDFFNYPEGYQQRHWYNEELPQAEVATSGATPTGIPVWLGRSLAERVRRTLGRDLTGRASPAPPAPASPAAEP